jgi:hypothetical protein
MRERLADSPASQVQLHDCRVGTAWTSWTDKALAADNTFPARAASPYELAVEAFLSVTVGAVRKTNLPDQ